MSLVSRAAVIFPSVHGTVYNGLMRRDHLLFHGARFFCVPGNPVYFRLMVAECLFHLLFIFKTFCKIGALFILCAQISTIAVLLISFYGNGKSGKIHIKNIRIIRIKSIPRRAEGF